MQRDEELLQVMAGMCPSAAARGMGGVGTGAAHRPSLGRGQLISESLLTGTLVEGSSGPFHTFPGHPIRC